MLNEFVEKILVHERARKGSQDTTQEIEIYFNFLGRYIPPSLYIFILSILCIAMVAPTFANEYQTGSDSIMRCTKNGRVKFSVIKILAAGVIFTVVFIVGMVIHLSIINLAFGAECLKTSFQMLFSIINLPNINLGQLQVILCEGQLCRQRNVRRLCYP